MSRAILGSSPTAQEAVTGGFADLQPLDEELASQLPKWELVPPHSFLVRKPRKAKPSVAPPPLAPAEPAPFVVAEPAGPADEAETQAATPDLPTDAVVADAGTEVPETDDARVSGEGAHAEAVLEPETAGAGPGLCCECSAELEPDSAFCPECGHKQ